MQSNDLEMRIFLKSHNLVSEKKKKRKNDDCGITNDFKIHFFEKLKRKKIPIPISNKGNPYKIKIDILFSGMNKIPSP